MQCNNLQLTATLFQCEITEPGGKTKGQKDQLAVLFNVSNLILPTSD